ncbi:MAG TPA: hypothetical protein PKN95_11605 [Verrucomicrobiota bacterium]|nr:hypothetical protein [Verrucomicrobiota bacterium]HNT15261.1 hypothetical protein [Verrucomicrobiota bacterium]
MLQRALALILATLWLPMTSHCLLFEAVIQAEFLACATPADTESSPLPASKSPDCNQDSCQVVENAQYKSSAARLAVPPLVDQLLFEIPALLSPTVKALRTGTGSSAENRAWLAASWQFIARTAPSPRAPSGLS